MAAHLKWTSDRLAALLEESREPGLSRSALGKRHGICRQSVAELLRKALDERVQRSSFPFTLRDLAEIFDVPLTLLERAAEGRPASRFANSLDKPPVRT